MNTLPRDLVVMYTHGIEQDFSSEGLTCALGGVAPVLRVLAFVSRGVVGIVRRALQGLVHRDTAWWYWAATAASLVVGIAGWPEAFFLATALGIAQILHFWVREGRLMAFPVQVRMVFTAVLVLCAWTPLNGLYWLPAAGALARVLFGYCLLARTLSLMPGNRRMPLTWMLAWRTFTAPPVAGSIIDVLSTPPLGQRSARHKPPV